MNKHIFSLLIGLLTVSGVFAQKNEIKAMYSPVSFQRIDSWGRNRDVLTTKYIGGFMIDYNRYLNSRLKLGVNVTYDQKKTTGKRTESYIKPYPSHGYYTTTYQLSDKSEWFFVGPQLGYDYIEKQNFRLGSLVGVSMVLDRFEATQSSKNSQVKLKGIHANLFFHAEVINFTWGRTNGLTGQLGFGHKGLVSIGYFIRW